MKKKIRKILSKGVILIAMAAIFYLLIQLQESAVFIFYWGISLFMIVNFWLHLKKEERNNQQHFFLALLIMAIFLMFSVLSLIGWITQTPMFNGFWKKIFGWHSFIVAMVLIPFYSFTLFDKSLRKDIRDWLMQKISWTARKPTQQ
jgi:hypothetical protein